MTIGPAGNEYPEEAFEIVEIDLTPYLTEEQKSWPVVVCQRPEEEFAIEEPLPALAVLVHGGKAPAEARLPIVVEALSVLETALGGSGLEMACCFSRNDYAGTTLVPRLVDGARGRFERIAKWAAAFGSEVEVTAI